MCWWRAFNMVLEENNCLDEDKIQSFSESTDDNTEFPPVIGYVREVTQDDIDRGSLLATMDYLTEEHLGLSLLFLVDGHHRAIASCRTGYFKIQAYIKTDNEKHLI